MGQDFPIGRCTLGNFSTKPQCLWRRGKASLYRITIYLPTDFTCYWLLRYISWLLMDQVNVSRKQRSVGSCWPNCESSRTHFYTETELLLRCCQKYTDVKVHYIEKSKKYLYFCSFIIRARFLTFTTYLPMLLI